MHVLNTCSSVELHVMYCGKKHVRVHRAGHCFDCPCHCLLWPKVKLREALGCCVFSQQCQGLWVMQDKCVLFAFEALLLYCIRKTNMK